MIREALAADHPASPKAVVADDPADS